MVWTRWQMARCGGAIASSLCFMVACQRALDSPPEALDTDAESPSTPTEKAAESDQPVASSDPSDAANTTANGTVAATPAQACSASAFVVDTDPAGLNVRSGPGSDFAVQDTLPTTVPVEVAIVGATSEWFLINEAWSGDQAELQRPGWVYAPLLGVSTTSLNINDPEAPTTLYVEPDGSAAVAAEIPKYSEVTLLGCAGNWLQVQATETTGWIAIGEQCSNPTATCP